MSGISEPASGRFNPPNSAIDNFKSMKEHLSGLVGEMLSLGISDRDSVLEIQEKLRSNTFNLVVVGQFKRGKTCLINALLGASILPVSVVPLTSIVTVLVYGEKLGAKVHFNNGQVTEIPVSELPDYVTESGNPKNEKDVREVVVIYPSPYLKDGVRLVDTPGVGSVYIHNTDVAYRYLPKSDAALFLLSIDQPASSAELEFLNDVREYADRIFFLLNKIDYLQEQEIGRALEFSKEAIQQVMGPDLKIFPISAKTALQGKIEDSPEKLEKSGLPAFSEVLNRFLLKEKGNVLLGSVSKNLLKIMSQARLELELEVKSLQTPVEQMREKVKAFEKKKTELVEERRNFDVLFRSEIDRAIIRDLDRGLTELKNRLLPEMEESFNQFYEEKKDLSLKELNDALEGFVRERIEAEFSAWQEQQEEKLSQAFDGVCRQFADRVNGVIDSLLSFSSQLFSVPFEPVEAESLWSFESTFRYKLHEDAVGLDMLTDSLTQVVPRYIKGKWFERLRNWAYKTANKVILNKRKQHMLEAIEMQSGRLRFDFIDRLNKSGSVFRAKLLKKMDTVSDGLVRAIARGMELRQKGEEDAAKMAAGLTGRISAMERVRVELSQVRESIEKL